MLIRGEYLAGGRYNILYAGIICNLVRMTVWVVSPVFIGTSLPFQRLTDDSLAACHGKGTRVV